MNKIKMNMKIFESSDSKTWNDIIQNSMNGTLYHTWEWLKILEKCSDSRLFPLVYFDTGDDRPFGAIPLFYTKKFGVKMVFSPPPGSAVSLGPVLINKGYKQHKFEIAYSDFQLHLDNFIKKLRPNYTLIITSPGLLDVRPFSWAHYKVTPFYTYKIDLSQGEEAIWQNLRKNTRRDINVARKNEIEIIEQTDEASTSHIYNSTLQRYTQNRLVFGVNQNYINELFRQFGHSYIKTFIALNRGQIIASLACTIHNHTICAWMGGARTENNELEVNKLLYWNIISWAIKNNYTCFELMGANTQRLCEFKSMFGPDISIYFGIEKMDFFGSLAQKIYYLRHKKRF